MSPLVKGSVESDRALSFLSALYSPSVSSTQNHAVPSLLPLSSSAPIFQGTPRRVLQVPSTLHGNNDAIIKSTVTTLRNTAMCQRSAQRILTLALSEDGLIVIPRHREGKQAQRGHPASKDSHQAYQDDSTPLSHGGSKHARGVSSMLRNARTAARSRGLTAASEEDGSRTLSSSQVWT